MTSTHRVAIERVQNTTQNNQIAINLNSDERFLHMFQNNPAESDFRINFGSDETPRFNCACHKLNLAIR